MSLPIDALYVHVPFCRAKCRYCDFYSLADADEAMGRYVDAVVAECRRRDEVLADRLASVYVGGGTPTVLPAEMLDRLLRPLGDRLADGGEFSVEANPNSLSVDKARRLVDCGVTRVTVGAQSFDADELAMLGRLHGPDEIARAVDDLRSAGVGRVGLDLIYGLPDQSPASWQESLARAIGCGVDHISAYALSIEPGTPLADDLAAGRICELDDETQRHMHAMAVETLRRAGFEWYEVSNFARPDFRSRQNLVYWHNGPYVGLGPAACSYIDGERIANGADLSAYCDALEAGVAPPAETERLGGLDAMAETLMLGLRLREGVSRRRFVERFGRDVAAALPATVERHVADGLLAMDDERLWIPDEHVFVMNAVLADFIAEAGGDA